MSEARRNESKRWFQQAAYDLKSSAWNIEGGFFSTSCFLSQQAAESIVEGVEDFYTEHGETEIVTLSQ